MIIVLVVIALLVGVFIGWLIRDISILTRVASNYVVTGRPRNGFDGEPQ